MNCHTTATKQLNVSLPVKVYRYATGQAKLSGMPIKEFVRRALIEYGKKCESERLIDLDGIELNDSSNSPTGEKHND